jgi:protein-tyrosine phosphatase
MNSNSTMAVPIPSSYWVLPGRFLAGEYPGAKAEAEAQQKVQQFLQSGVGFFVDLTCENELSPYAHHLQGDSSATVSHHRFPIRDFNIPTIEEMIATLDAIDTALGKKQVVYVHCWGGIGRTGTVVGCHLVRHGMSGQGALAEIKRMRRNIPLTDRIRSSPETSAQRQMVLNWKNGQ